METADRAAAMDIFNDSHVTLEQVARSGGVGRSSLFGWKSGGRNPTPASLAKWADGLEREGRRLLSHAANLRSLLDRLSGATLPGDAQPPAVAPAPPEEPAVTDPEREGEPARRQTRPYVPPVTKQSQVDPTGRRGKRQNPST